MSATCVWREAGYAPAMIVVTNRIPVAEGFEIDFEDRFRKRVHLVDQAKGFIRKPFTPVQMEAALAKVTS